MNILSNKSLYLLTIITFSSLPLMAQGAPPATPIDGGLSLLLAAGGAYASKKIYEKMKNS